MGDFNDMPFNRSLMDYAFSAPYREQVAKSEHVPFFYNLMWSLISQGFGTYYFGKKEPDPCHDKYTTYPNMLDQFMVSKSIAFEKRISVKNDSVRVNKVIGEYNLFEERYSYEVPKKFGRPTKCGKSSYMNKEGFSDHFPISLIIQDSCYFLIMSIFFNFLKLITLCRNLSIIIIIYHLHISCKNKALELLVQGT